MPQETVDGRRDWIKSGEFNFLKLFRNCNYSRGYFSHFPKSNHFYRFRPNPKIPQLPPLLRTSLQPLRPKPLQRARKPAPPRKARLQLLKLYFWCLSPERAEKRATREWERGRAREEERGEFLGKRLMQKRLEGSSNNGEKLNLLMREADLGKVTNNDSSSIVDGTFLVYR